MRILLGKNLFENLKRNLAEKVVLEDMKAVIYFARNKINRKMYVGFALDFEDRKNIHKCEALSRKSSFVFHKAIRKYGWEAFEWDILEEGEASDLLSTREAFYISKLNTFYLDGKGYNMTKGGDGILGYRFSDAQRKRLSEAHLGRPLSVACRQAMSKAHTGRINSTTHNENIRKARSLKWQITCPDGSKQIIQDLKQYCINNNLRYSAMHRIASGKMNSHRGYSCILLL